MAVVWKTNPPYANWKDYSDSLNNYANASLAESGVACPRPHDGLAEEGDAQLRRSRASDRSFLVAAYLLPLFEDTGGWEADVVQPRRQGLELDFQDFLAAWHQRVPQRHKKFVRQVQTLFGTRTSERVARCVLSRLRQRDQRGSLCSCNRRASYLG